MFRRKRSVMPPEIFVELWALNIFVAKVELAHEEHLRTGDYVSLGIKTQDALLELQRTSLRTTRAYARARGGTV